MEYLTVRQDPEGIFHHSAGPAEGVVEHPFGVDEAVMRIGLRHQRPKPRGIISDKGVRNEMGVIREWCLLRLLCKNLFPIILPIQAESIFPYVDKKTLIVGIN